MPQTPAIGTQSMGILTAPVLSSLVLNTTNVSTNDTNVNLTAYNISNTAKKIIWNWLRNDTSFMLLNMPFEGINNTATDNAWDYSGYGYNGIEMGATWTGTGGYGGRGAYAFDGSNDVVAADLPLIVSASDPITIAAWIKPNTIAGTQTIISKGA